MGPGPVSVQESIELPIFSYMPTFRTNEKHHVASLFHIQWIILLCTAELLYALFRIKLFSIMPGTVGSNIHNQLHYCPQQQAVIWI